MSFMTILILSVIVNHTEKSCKLNKKINVLTCKTELKNYLEELILKFSWICFLLVSIYLFPYQFFLNFHPNIMALNVS